MDVNETNLDQPEIASLLRESVNEKDISNFENHDKLVRFDKHVIIAPKKTESVLRSSENNKDCVSNQSDGENKLKNLVARPSILRSSEISNSSKNVLRLSVSDKSEDSVVNPVKSVKC